MDYLQAGSNLIAIIGGLAATVLFFWKARRRWMAYSYPSTGEGGDNVLSPEVTVLKVGRAYAVSAVVPEDRTLLLIIQGQAVENFDALPHTAARGAWHYQVGPSPLNWRGRPYEEGSPSHGPKQIFRATSGPAEMVVSFARVGKVTLFVFEKDPSVPRWTKELVVCE